MTLARLISTSETELICDFAEFYHVYDWRALPLKTAGALAAGLGENSRCGRKDAGYIVSTDTILAAMLIDRLTDIGICLGVYKPKDVPKITPLFIKPEKTEHKSGFKTPEDYETKRREIINRINKR